MGILKIEQFKHIDVLPDGRVVGGGAVETLGMVRYSFNKGCGIPGCKCSEGIYCTFVLPRTEEGVVEGFVVFFETKKDLGLFLEAIKP